jgi:SAM-dependent methyltransferase
MSAAHLFAQIQRLTIPTTALAAVGAELRLRLDEAAGDPATRPLLRQVARALDPALLEDVGEAQMHAALGAVRAALLEALALLDEPARAPGWQPRDAALPAALGTASRMRVAAIEAIAAPRPDMAAVLRRPGTFLDVGTGTAGLAMEAARRWPALDVLGIDVWEPSLAQARAALAGSDVAHRVELRQQDVRDLAERDAISLAWVPTPFLPATVLEAALPVLHAALVPGGWLVLGLLRIPGDPLGEAAAKLRVARTGGHPWQPVQLAALLERGGWRDVEMLEQASGTSHVIGRRGA